MLLIQYAAKAYWMMIQCKRRMKIMYETRDGLCLRIVDAYHWAVLLWDNGYVMAGDENVCIP